MACDREKDWFLCGLTVILCLVLAFAPRPALAADAGENEIQVELRLVGDQVHKEGGHQAYVRWLHQADYPMVKETSVLDLAMQALKAEDWRFKYIQGSITGIENPLQPGQWLENGGNGGQGRWVYSVNGAYPTYSMAEYNLQDGDKIIIAYADDLEAERASQPWLKAVGPSVLPKQPAETAIPEFSDVPAGHWAAEAIGKLAAQGVVSGQTVTEFAPEAAVSRAEFVAMLARLAQADLATPATASFADVAVAEWYAPAVAWAKQQGIVNGDGIGFAPEQPLSREALAALLLRYLQQTADRQLPTTEQPLTFADAGEISPYARQAVATLQAAGLLQGRENNCFAPQANVTRAEAAKLLAETADITTK